MYVILLKSTRLSITVVLYILKITQYAHKQSDLDQNYLKKTSETVTSTVKD